MNSLSLREVKAGDKDGLWRAYTKWPGSIRRSLVQNLELPERRTFSSVALAGMGGSGSACDILADWLRPKIRVPVCVTKDYQIPGFAGRDTLVLLVSLGGSTKETRSALRQAVERGCSAATISSGGLIEDQSRELGVPFNRVENLLVPRASTPGMIIVGARILAGLELIKDISDFGRAADEVQKALAQAEPSVPFGRNRSKRLAREFQGKRVVVYSPEAISSVAVHFKNSMNENAKVPVQVETYPELFHNEIETWVTGLNRTVLLLRLAETEEKTKAELATLGKLFRKFNTHVTELQVERNGLGTLLAWSLTLDLASVYLAVLKGRAPAPTPILSSLKKD